MKQGDRAPSPLAVPAAPRAIPTIKRLIDRGALFADCGYVPHKRQALMHASRARRRVLACGVRWGKTKGAAMEGVAAAMEPADYSIGWVVALTYELAERVFREIHRTFAEKFPHRIMLYRAHDMTLKVVNMGGGVSEIRGKTASSPASLLGEGLDWLIVDEAAQIPGSIWNSYLSQRLIDKQGWAIMISTPKGKGWFYDMWRNGQPGPRKRSDWESWNAPSWTNPLLPRSAIVAERERLGSTSIEFRQEYGAEFVEGAGSVFRNVRDVATGIVLPPGYTGPTADGRLVLDPLRTYVGGLDLAKVNDYTVYTIMDDLHRVVFVDRFNKVDWSIQSVRLKSVSDRYGGPPTLVDSTGIGEPIFEALCAADLNVKPYVLSAGSKKVIIDNLALAFERKRIQLLQEPIFPAMVDELELFQWSITNSGHVTSGSPVGYNDDCVISLALAEYEASRAWATVDEPYPEWT